LTETERRDRLHSLVYSPRSPGSPSYLQDQLQAAGYSLYVYTNDKSNNPGLFYGGKGGEMVTNTSPYDRSILEAEKDQNLWPFIFIVGGAATYDSYGRLTGVAKVTLTASQKAAVREIILKIKPVHSWCILVVNDWDYFTLSATDAPVTSTTQGFADDDTFADTTTGGFWRDPDYV